MNEWTGNKNSVYQTIGASNHSDSQREANDYYATEPKAVEILLKNEEFDLYVWEPACGEGHISKILKENDYNVKSSDIIDRGFPETEIIDFLKVQKSDIKNDFSRDIITNPPYKFAKEFVEKAIEISVDSTKIAMFLKLTFLEGQSRRELFKKYPPKTVYVFSKRMECGKNGIFTGSSAVAYAWFVWEKGFHGDPVLKWVN